MLSVPMVSHTCSYINERNRQRNVSRAEQALREELEVDRQKKDDDPFTRRRCKPTLVNLVRLGRPNTVSCSLPFYLSLILLSPPSPPSPPPLSPPLSPPPSLSSPSLSHSLSSLPLPSLPLSLTFPSVFYSPTPSITSLPPFLPHSLSQSLSLSLLRLRRQRH